MAGYIGTQAVSVNTTSATISDDLAVGDDLTVTDDAAIGGTLGVTGIATFTDDIIIGDGKTIGSASDVDAITIAANGQVTLTQTLIGTALDISGNIDVDGITNLDVVDIDGAVNLAAAMTLTSASYFIASAAQGYRFNNAADNANNMIISDAGLVTVRNGIDLTDGNLIVASGHGIQFSSASGSGSAQNSLLDDYEEGTWAATGNGITLADQVSLYVKIGNIVHVGCKIVFPTTSDTGLAQINGFPFASVNSQAARAGLVVSFQDEGSSNGLQILVGTNVANAQLYLGSTTKSNANMSGHTVFFGGTYLSDN